jgi:hypothetical protein
MGLWSYHGHLALEFQRLEKRILLLHGDISIEILKDRVLSYPKLEILDYGRIGNQATAVGV